MYRSLSKTPRQKLIAAKAVEVCVNMEKLRNKGKTMERKDQGRLRTSICLSILSLVFLRYSSFGDWSRKKSFACLRQKLV
jgi:hypothetical protein